MQNKLKTIIMVIILSCLIWVFAEREVTQSAVIEINLNKATQLYDDLLVQFLNDHGNPTQEASRRCSLTLEGPGRRILKVQQGEFENDIALDIVELLGSRPENLQPQVHEFDIVKQLFNNEYQHEDIYLKVTKSQPAMLRLQVQKLVPITLNVKVYDAESQTELETELRQPAQVEAYQIQDQPAAAAIIRLKPEQKLLATKEPIQMVAQVKLPDRVQTFDVMIKLPEESGLLALEEIKTPRLGILMPSAMMPKFEVEIEDRTPLKEQPLKFRGTAAAITEYRESPYHLVLEINAGDTPNTLIDRQLQYYLPPGRLDELEFPEQNTILIKFRLVPITPNGN